MVLSIVIVKYKTKGLLKQCIKGIQLLNLDFDYEIFVIDNDSSDGTEEMIRNNFLGVKYIDPGKNIGFSGGCNLGMKRATGKYVLILNPDILIVANDLGRMIEYMDLHREVGMLGPRLINPDGSVQMSCYRFPSFFIPFYRRTFVGKLPGFKNKVRKYLMEDWNHDENREVDWLLGGCQMVRHTAMDKVGLMDERFFVYFEDVDYCRRFWEADYKVVYFADAEVIHYHMRTSAESWWGFGMFRKVAREHIKSWIKYFAKNFGAKNPRKKK